ncbi:MAG: hypothetical protein EBW54_13320 [Betaproteobacteria bacterium]|nr:hypothetical protein [Betaproteobacteria bacterium]NDF77197.1 hypothetical protein [Betaproteobacteria bacterium]
MTAKNEINTQQVLNYWRSPADAPEVVSVEEDGKFVTVAFTQDNGERVVARFQISGWKVAPRAEIERVMRILARSPIRVTGARLTNR